MSKKTFKGFGPESNDAPTSISSRTLQKWYAKALDGDIEHQLKVTNYMRSLWNKSSYQYGSSMIHEKDYEPMTCCLCGKEMTSIHDTHNPYPLTKKCTAKQALQFNLPDRCCTECVNKHVRPARLSKMPTGGAPVLCIPDFFQGDMEFLAGHAGDS